MARARKNNRTTINETVAQNTMDTVDKIMQLSTIIKTAVDEGRLIIVGLTYQLHDGHTTVVAQYGGDEAAVSNYTS